MDELNLHLQSLIQELCSYPASSSQHRKTLNRLLRVILKSRRLWRPPTGDVYEQTLYEEALHKTMVKITKTLCEKYNPSLGSFLAWFNKCLENQYRDEIRAAKRERSYRQPVWQGDELDIDPLDKVISPVDATLLLQTWESFVQWVTNDPDNILRSCHIANNPTANCQLLAHLRIVGGKEWQQIATEVGSPRGAVTSHWCRKCEFFMRQWLDTNQRLFGEDSYDR